MSSPDRDLVTREGVEEGSAASTAEADTGPEPDGVVGEPPHGAPADESAATGPDDVDTAGAARTRAERGSGQQLAQGEG